MCRQPKAIHVKIKHFLKKCSAHAFVCRACCAVVSDTACSNCEIRNFYESRHVLSSSFYSDSDLKLLDSDWN